MNKSMKLCFRNAYKDQRGQMLPIIAFMMICFLGMAGIVTDVGRAYFSYRLLVSSTNAAAMAGAQGLALSGTQALANAKAYSSLSGQNNAYANLNVSNAYYKLGCVTATVGSAIPCVSVTGGTANAIQVTQTASVPTTFMGLFGYSSIPISATGTALMRGAAPKTYNLAVVIDTTASMATNDTNCGKNISRLTCALNGVQTLLQTISPCATGGCGSLGSDGNYTNAVDRVSLFTFPEPSSSTQAANDYNCSGKNPTITPYTYPTANATSYSPSSGTPTYQVTSFLSNYQSVSSGSATGSLNTNTGTNGSNVALAVGAHSGCGMQDPGGEGTYYAGVIYAAEGALLAQQAAEAANNQTVQNAMIIVSDGAATSCYSGTVVVSGKSKSVNTCGTGSSQMSPTGITSTGTYPSYVNECAQAVQAAQDAASKGITVYSVAYGAGSSGCTTDTGSYTSPCATMKAMASDPNTTFYSDANQSGSGSTCTSPLAPAGLGAIFQSIGGQLTAARLIPNSTFPSS